MEIFRAEGWGWPEYLIDLAVQLAGLAALIALTIWVWPNGIEQASFWTISIKEWARAAASIFTFISSAAALYFIVLEFVQLVAKGTPRGSSPADLVVAADNDGEI